MGNSTRMRMGLALVAVLTIARASLAAGQQANRLQAGDRVAVCGDSITEQKLYTAYVQLYLIACQPAADLRTCQFGWSGEQAPGFLGRMGNDVLWFKPTVATTAYGMNDGQYQPFKESTGKRYGDAMRGIVKKFKEAGVRMIIVGSPGCTDPVYMKAGQIPQTYNETLAQLRDVARQVAEEEGVVFANVFDAMLDAQKKAKQKFGEKLAFSGGDGFHPGPNGQLAMAYAFLKAMGCDGNIGAVTLDLATNKAEATSGHKVLSAAGGAVELESTRYPFCFTGEVNEPSTRNAAEVLPFNAELNRFVLKVTGAGAEKLKVTWGGATREFSAADLEKGINLAAEFMDASPFAPAFAEVEKRVREQQNFETPLHKELLNRMAAHRRMLPEATEAFDRIVAAGAGRQQALADAASAAVKPVRHTIRVEK